MNGTGYDYTAPAYSNFEGLESLLNGQQSQSKHNHRAPHNDRYNPSGTSYHNSANGPETNLYDPTRVSAATSLAAAQHRLIMASVSHAYTHGAGSHHTNANNIAALIALTSPSSAYSDYQAIMQRNAFGEFEHQLQLHGHHQLGTQQSSQNLRDSILDSEMDLHSTGLASKLTPTNPANVTQQPQPILSSAVNEENDVWLQEIKLDVPSLSLEKLDGKDVEKTLRRNMNDVITRYITCVEFLVHCQQELRKGIDIATQKSKYASSRRKTAQHMTPGEFFSVYVDQLPNTFYKNNCRIMDCPALEDAYQDLQKLRTESKNAERQGCEAVKSNFLGGMKDGESWGLRKWLSKHGNALKICTDIEGIMNACQKLDKTCETTRKLSNLIRPMGKTVLDKLLRDIPTSYQARSTAHPFLPFFHRLEAALRLMTSFDPDDDNIICLDDSDDEDDVIVAEVPLSSTAFLGASNQQSVGTPKRKFDDLPTNSVQTPSKRTAQIIKIPERNGDDESSSGESDTESVIEIFQAKTCTTGEAVGWTCFNCTSLNAAAYVLCQVCGEEASLNHFTSYKQDVAGMESRRSSPSLFDCNSSFGSTKGCKRNLSAKETSLPSFIASPSWPLIIADMESIMHTAYTMAHNLDNLATLFDDHLESTIRPNYINNGHFWHGRRFADALRLFVEVLRNPESPYFVDQVDENRVTGAGNPPFSCVIKHPICFKDIVSSLIEDAGKSSDVRSSSLNGCLPTQGLSKWNMWIGSELLQAIDLVLLNSLAYGKALKQGRSCHRSKTNKIRKDFWDGIKSIVHSHVENSKERKLCMPIRRSEENGFVVFKVTKA